MVGDEPEKGAASSLSEFCVNSVLESSIFPKNCPALARGICRQFQLPFCHPFRFRHHAVADPAQRGED
jgi:hypothetical protein